MDFLNSIFSWVIKKRMHQIELFIKYPHDVQNEWFQRLISTAKDTEWGKRYDFKTIKTIDQFKSRVPVQGYDRFKDDIIRIKQGEQNILWPTEVKWFAKSSGTSNDKSKFIPVTKEALEECHYNGGKDMLSMYYNNIPTSKLFSGKTLVVGGSSQVNQFSSDSYYGDLSAIIMKNFPFWVEFRRTPSLSVALMDEWEPKLQKMAEITSKEDVTNISGVPSWTLILLRKILEITGETDIKKVWPNLELFMHGGVNFEPYKTQYQQLIKDNNMHYLETYNATEGFFGIQDQVHSNEMLLMLDYGIFYEFLPMDELGNEHPKTLLLDEVELGVNYALIISTNAGLWRYDIGDTIKFTSLNPYRIKVTGRTKHFINVFGEELMVHNVENAITHASKQTQSTVKDFTVAPHFSDSPSLGAHEWLIEFETPPINIDFFTEILDTFIKASNSDYESKRYKSMAVGPPKIRVLTSGTFYAWMKHRGKLGGQNKVPRLFNDRRYVDEIISFVESRLNKISA
jgi:hypothetical protein